MRPEQIYQHLTDLAEKLNVSIRCEDLSSSGFPVKSGLCRIKGEQVFIMDSSRNISEKIRLLSACLKEMDLENVFVAPAVRALLKE